MSPPRILIADDHPQVREALRKLLEPVCDVIACVGDGRALVKSAVELKPDLVLVDVGLPLLNGLEAGRALKKLMPQVKLFYLSMDSDPDIANEAFRIGASGYLLKSSMGEELLQAIRKAVNEHE
jgi:DNA-binding NarL/FixJ family response regulator